MNCMPPLDARHGRGTLASMTEIADLTASEAARRIAAGSLTASALAEACLARISEREPDVRAFAWLDPALVRRGAAALDKGGPPAPLKGIPFGVKDVLDTADMPSQYGSPIYAGHRPRSDSAAVAMARAAGALIIGKTITTEFATRHPGATTNPANKHHTPGGSSSGSAAGVAAGFFPLSFGTQTGGSIIRPAAFCGIVGFKPSFGTIHRGGMKVMSESHDTIGVMARSVADCALSMGAMTGRDYGNPEAKLPRAPRLAFTLGPPATKAAPETLALMERAIAACRKAGAEVVEITLPEVMTEAFDAHEYVTNMESVQSLGWELVAARAQLSDTIKEKLDWAKRFPTAQLDACKLVQAKARAALPGALEGFDAVITASAAGEAPAGIGWTGDAAFNSLWTLLHGPCVTVPAGDGPKGLPLGVQIAGRIGEDAKVLAIGEWVSQAL